MGDKPPKPKMRVNGREMMRIQGVYMYIINGSGQVGAIMGFFPLVVVMYEDTSDMEPIRGYLRVDRWVYPLARSFSPIYIWGPDRLILPEPFSSLTEPIYVVIRIPFGMSKFQKDTLWNLLDVNAHVCGKFADLTNEELLQRDQLFALTELTPKDNMLLDQAAEGTCPPGTKELPSLYLNRMQHKLFAFEHNVGRRSVCFAPDNIKKLFIDEHKEKHRRKSGEKVKCPPPSYWQAVKEHNAPLLPPNAHDNLMDHHGNHRDLVTLPAIRGNLMRLYILGPRDPQHIQISTVMEWIPVIELMLKAVYEAFDKQVRLRGKKELHGVPPSFEGRRKRLVGGWGGAEALNTFGLARRTESCADGPYMDPNKVDPSYKTMFQAALSLQNLEAAAGVFDYAMDKCKLELLAFSSSLDETERSSPTRWLGPLIPRVLVVRYHRLETSFAKLMTLSAAVESDLVYEKYTNYLERIHEDCEHHYPKLRPRNPLLDPQYPYPREPVQYRME